jgi:bifunctional DNA-binding transcriptional regulator/antitoxin component of YhaV-PrlF toxin-antitoxin module
MSVVEVDDRGRFTIPREIGLRGTKAVIIPAGTFFVVIPIKGDPYKLATSWLKTEKSIENLKDEAEALASEDAAMRKKRREQPC